jgi:thiamine phosphate synthase YjbQ (UPF0047 family)
MAYDSQNFEGADDKPTHIKASLLGNNLSITIVDGTLGLGLGLWQGIVLGEHRVRAESHHLIATIRGK